MSKRVDTYLVDDLTEERDETVKERVIALDNRRVVIDLSDDSYAELEEKLAPYFTAGRPRRAATAPRQATRATPKVKTVEPTTSDIRAWAKRRRVKVAARGRIPNALREQYIADPMNAA
ncbi:Lsr2 dimerization domain-containing protein [Streptomyces olivoreticuli]|uniref:Lsr2 dimerization domain-containing protein n=1 Tax=Streptomyces olivoreticuli TaxID=68246 RepID=UPI000E23CB67|nr:histone-like nucleoid-structuring protein Lsr2 [Streptomyces olivoreticuli]